MRASQNHYFVNVKCPCCVKGVSEQKCYSTASVLRCGTCKKYFFAFAYNGIVTTATMESASSIFPAMSRMTMYCDEMQKYIELQENLQAELAEEN